MDTPWFELLPDRYKRELAELQQIDIELEEDAEMKAKGCLRLRLRIDGSNKHFNFPDKNIAYELIAVFPESYPWFRPEVYAYGLVLPRHQHLRGKNLCLLNRGTEEWDPTETLAQVLKSQLDEVLEKGTVTDYKVISADEREQAEPYSDYYNTNLLAPILFDPTPIPDTPTTTVPIIVGTIKVGMQDGSIPPCRMAVINLTFSGSNVSHKPNDEIVRTFSHKKIEGILIDVPHHPPITEDYHVFYNWLNSVFNELRRPINPGGSVIRHEKGSLNYVVGISFPEETRKGVEGKGWIFVVLCSVRERADRKAKDGFYLAKPAYIGLGISKERVPRLLPLLSKTVSICGLGALGSFVAIELARCGVGKLKLLDFDVVAPPTTVRWPLGMEAAGKLKTTTVAEFIKKNYPDTQVEILSYKIGSIQIEGNTTEFVADITDKTAVNFLSEGSDLMIDATAEEGVTHYLTRVAVRKKLPHLVLYATPGAWGGLVMRWLPGETEGCWNCMRHWQSENNELVPPVDDQGLVQPPGCGDITFTGASFDLHQVSTVAVRMAVSMLCSQEENGYPKIDHDWAVLKLVDKQNNPIFPSWQAQKLLRHSNCGYCEKNAIDSMDQ